MATPSRIREAAFHMLFQLDAQGPSDLVESGEGETLTAKDRDKACSLAHAAFEGRAEADAAIERFAPGWPAHRQPAVDRAILRLAHHEMVRLEVAPAIAINDAVELAKRYSTERSPGFVNAVLDRVAKEVVGGGAGEAPSVMVEDAHDTSLVKTGEEADVGEAPSVMVEDSHDTSPVRTGEEADVPDPDAAQKVVPPGEQA